jgi:hypothetical protein
VLREVENIIEYFGQAGFTPCLPSCPRMQWASGAQKLFACAAQDALTLCVIIPSAGNTTGER